MWDAKLMAKNFVTWTLSVWFRLSPNWWDAQQNMQVLGASTSVSNSDAIPQLIPSIIFYFFLLFSFSLTSLAPEAQTRREKMINHPAMANMNASLTNQGGRSK
ncbi:unnamed protein product [Dovyalis caffra]|uniref:Uncharacterized protein n=1 Tax=Dovyalis caffra TaxID=77055 RepID=A0AAV1S7E7_9ROSI|nr:unnamed protein product [Dovyalis caffra]